MNMNVRNFSGKGTINYTRCAAVYEGEFSDSKPHGVGKMTYRGGRVYEGEWVWGQMQGKGTETLSDGSSYEGEWQAYGGLENSKRRGKGIRKRPDGSVWYEAEYKDSNRLDTTDTATVKFGNGDVYEGEFSSDKPHGVGKMAYNDGRVCEGIWNNGEIVYEGELNESGKPHGRGKKMYPIGGVYEGGWKNGKQHGKGTYKRSDGSVMYDGEYKDNMWHGKGSLNYRNGDVYTGDWLSHTMQGRGVMTYTNQDVYDGEWKGGRKNGQGVMKFHNGDVYEGEFSNNEMHGKGTYTYAAGDLSKSIGEWKNGKKCGEFEDIVRFSKKVYYENDEVKVDSNVKREAPFDEDTDTEDAPPPSKRRNVCVSPPQPQV